MHIKMILTSFVTSKSKILPFTGLKMHTAGSLFLIINQLSEIINKYLQKITYVKYTELKKFIDKLHTDLDPSNDNIQIKYFTINIIILFDELLKEIINNHQLIKLTTPISGYYRSKRNRIRAAM